MKYHFDPPKIYKYPRHRLCDIPIDPWLFNHICKDLWWASKSLGEADDLDTMTAEKGEELRQYMHDMVGSMQTLLWHVEPFIQRIATPEVIEFEKTGTGTMDIVLEYQLLEGQALYNQGVVFEQLKCVYPEGVIRGIDGGFIVPAKPEDIKLLEVMEWAQVVRKA